MVLAIRRFWMEPGHDILHLDGSWQAINAGLDPVNPSRWWVIAQRESSGETTEAKQN